MLRLTSRPDEEISHHCHTHKLSSFRKNNAVKYSGEKREPAHLFHNFTKDVIKKEHKLVESLLGVMYVFFCFRDHR